MQIQTVGDGIVLNVGQQRFFEDRMIVSVIQCTCTGQGRIDLGSDRSHFSFSNFDLLLRPFGAGDTRALRLDFFCGRTYCARQSIQPTR